jgi:hypothetical protein
VWDEYTGYYYNSRIRLKLSLYYKLIQILITSNQNSGKLGQKD